MTSKLNLTSVKKYSKQYASKLNDEFYSRNEIITGKKILNLSHINQVNLFSIKQLSDNWIAEMEKIRSPYFDYEAQDVKRNLTNLMNALSQNIAVKRADFEPILEKATFDTLLLLLNPKQYFSEQVKSFENFTVRLDDLKNLEKFAKINKHIPAILTEKITETGTDFIYVNSALKWIDEIPSNSFEIPDRFLKLFAEKVPVELSDLQNDDDVQMVGDEEINLKEPKSFFDSIYLTDTRSSNDVSEVEEQSSSDNFDLPPLNVEAILADTREEVESKPKSVPDAPVFAPFDAPAPVQVVAVKQPEAEVLIVEPAKVFTFVEPKKEEKREENKTLNEQFSINSGINDQMKASQSLHDFQNSNKIEGLENAISLNQKFLFINRLFGNDTNSYQHALDELESCKDFFEAKELILRKYVTRFSWDITSNEAEEYIEIVRRRFS